MATTNLKISIQAFVEGLQQVQALGAQMQALGPQAAAAGAAGATAGAGMGALKNGATDAASGLTKFLEESGKASASFNSLVGYAKMAATAFLGFAALDGLKGMADTAAKTQTLGVTLGIVGKNAGYTVKELTDYENEVKAVGITTGAAREAIMGMVQAGLPLGPMAAGAASNIKMLAKMSQDLAVVTNQNSSDTLKKLITNIQQLDTEGLRWMGIVVNMDEATTKYAQAHGKVAGALTASEKQQALMNAAQEKGALLAGAYDAALETVGKKLSSMKRYQEEAANTIGDMLLPAYAVLVDAATAFLKSVQSIAKGISDTGQVAETLKNAVKSALEFAGQIVSALVDAVKKLAPVFESTFGKLQEAFSDIQSGGILDFFKKLLDQAVEVASVIVEAIGNAAPSIRLLVDAFGDLFTTIGSIFTELFSLGEGMRDSAADGELLSTVIQTIGLLVAGFADGLQVIKAVGEVMFAGMAIGFGGIAGVIGDLVGLLFPSLGKSITDVADKAIALGFASVEGAVKTGEAFAEGRTNVQKYADSLAQLPAAHEKDAEAAKKASESKVDGFKQAEELVRQYTRAVNDGVLKGDAAAAAYKTLRTEVGKLAAEYGFSQEKVERLNASMSASLEKSDKTASSLKDLGFGASELGKGLSEAGEKGRTAFNTLEQSGKYTSEQLYVAFNKALNMETSINGLKGFSEAASQAFKDGKLSAQAYESAVQSIAAKFEDLFEKQLKSAKTKEDFDQLRAVMVKAGEDGTVSMQRVALGLKEIDEKATGAKKSVESLAAQQTALATENTKLARAELDITKSLSEVASAKNAVLKAENDYKKSGSALDKAMLDDARAQQSLAEARLSLSRAKFQEESAGMDVLIAKQRQENAEKEKGLHIGDAGYAAAAAAAADELKSKNLVLESAKQNTQAAEQNVVATEGAVVKSKSLVENLRNAEGAMQGTAAAAEDMQTHLNGLADALGSWYSAILNTGYALKQVGFAADEAAEAQERATRQMNAPTAGWDMFFQNLANAYDIQIKMAKEFREQMGQAKDFEDNFNKVTASAEKTALAAHGIVEEADKHVSISKTIDAVYQKINEAAWSIVRAGKESLASFQNSALSIHEELLKAKGLDDEAARSRFASRQKELALEYQMLDVKLMAAEISAKAAGIQNTGLDKARKDAADAFAKAKSDLAELEKIELNKIATTKAAQAQKDKETAAAAAAQKAKEAAAEATAAREAELAIATARASSLSNGSGITPSSSNLTGSTGKTITVQLQSGNSVINTTIAAGDEAALLDLLAKAKKVT